MSSFWQDLRFGLRGLLGTPGFSTVALLTLALGIAATSAVFSLVEGVLLTPPPYSKPNRLVLISPVRKDGQPYLRDWPMAQFIDFQKASSHSKRLLGMAGPSIL